MRNTIKTITLAIAAAAFVACGGVEGDAGYSDSYAKGGKGGGKKGGGGSDGGFQCEDRMIYVNECLWSMGDQYTDESGLLCTMFSECMISGIPYDMDTYYYVRCCPQ